MEGLAVQFAVNLYWRKNNPAVNTERLKVKIHFLYELILVAYIYTLVAILSDTRCVQKSSIKL